MESSEGEYDEELEEVYETEPCTDLFSNKSFSSPKQCLNYCKDVHGFDIQILKQRHTMDCFSFIKMINYIRREKPSPGLVMSLSSDSLWNHSKYYKPVLENDALLTYDIEFEEEDDGFSHLNNGLKSIGEKEDESLLGKLKEELRGKNEEIEILLGDLEKLRRSVKSVFAEDEKEEEEKKNEKKESSFRNSKVDDEDYYAGSYSHFGIHHEMLSDSVRTNGYRKAILENQSSSFKDRNILDLGCGTGILSLFCIQGQANSVTAVDMSDIIIQAMDIALENKVENKITFHKGRIENLSNIKKNSFDVIVSEWMGYFLLYEGMLDSLMYARTHYLKKDGGRLFPNRVSLHLVAISDEARYKATIEYWKNVYGFSMSILQRLSLREASIEVVPGNKVVSGTSAQILNLDLEKCSASDYVSFSSSFDLLIESPCSITALVGYFDTFFDGPNSSVSFSTGPHELPTHWKQTVFYLEEKVVVTEPNTQLSGHILVSRPPKDLRSLKIKITFNGKEQLYTIE